MTCAAPAASSPIADVGPRVWVIFDTSGPHRFVARKFLCSKVFTFTTDEELSGDTVEAVRALLPEGLINIGKRDERFSTVVETWAPV